MSRKTSSILVQDVPVTVMSIDQRDYISLTDMAKARTDAGRAADVIKNWLRTRSTLEFLGTWEIMYNPDFKVVEFDHFKSEAGLHTFTLSTKTLPLAAKQNIRDFASIAQLTVLSNLETHNAEMIKQGIDKAERFDRLKQIAEYQLRVLTEAEAIQKLPKGNDNE